VPGQILNAATRYAVWWAVLAVTVALPLACISHATSSKKPLLLA
jgi:hypothetical protein